MNVENQMLFESRGIHTRPYSGATNDWITPKWVIDALGPFDLDPCASTHQPWPCAANQYTYHDDGLRQPWSGRVWLNPPYGPNTGRWLERLAKHGNGLALIPARTETGWFQEQVWAKATGMLFLKGRLTFHRPDGSLGIGNSGHSSVLVAYGEGQLRGGIHGAYVAQWERL